MKIFRPKRDWALEASYVCVSSLFLLEPLRKDPTYRFYLLRSILGRTSLQNTFLWNYITACLRNQLECIIRKLESQDKVVLVTETEDFAGKMHYRRPCTEDTTRKHADLHFERYTNSLQSHQGRNHKHLLFQPGYVCWSEFTLCYLQVSFIENIV